jgi:phospholipid/cholesterol/gamma-HCH transport system substrate-binding protein
MQTIQLGQSTLQVTPICLDPTTFGEQVVQATAHSILDRALERGIKFIAGGGFIEPIVRPRELRGIGRSSELMGKTAAERQNERRRAAPSREGPLGGSAVVQRQAWGLTESEAVMRSHSESTAPQQGQVEQMSVGSSNAAGSSGRVPRSPESRARWAFAWLVLLGGVAGLAWFGLASSRSALYEVRTHDSVSGLMADAPVEFHGVEVGKVSRVELTGPASVRLVLQVRKDTPVSTATVATITSRGLASKGFTGYVYVALENDGDGVGPMAVAGDGYPQIRSAPSRSISLDTAISQVSVDVQNLSRLLQASLDDKTIASLKQSLASMEQVTRTLAANSDKMNAIILSAERSSKRVEPLLQSGQEAATVLRTQVLPQAHQALANLDRASSVLIANTERASSRLEPLLESSHESAKVLQTQLLPEAYDAIAKLDRLASTLNGVATRIERDPSVVLRGSGRRPPGPGETR